MPGLGDRIKASFDAWVKKQNEERKKKNKDKKPPKLKDIESPYKIKKGGLYGGKGGKQLSKVDY